MPNLLRRKFTIHSIENPTDIRTIVHMQYLAWPDHGAPEESDYKIIGRILDYVREYH
jgi:protein tyrosine phosphatase